MFPSNVDPNSRRRAKPYRLRINPGPNFRGFEEYEQTYIGYMMTDKDNSRTLVDIHDIVSFIYGYSKTNISIDFLTQGPTATSTATPTVTPTPTSTQNLRIQPATKQIADYIKLQCRSKGLPQQIGLAIAWTESKMTQFTKGGSTIKNENKDPSSGKIASTDWGIMQINDYSWGEDFDFARIKSNWKYNIEKGIFIAKIKYDEAIKRKEPNLARATYSGYNSGSYFDRYIKENDQRDINFWNYYLNSPWLAQIQKEITKGMKNKYG
jgi:hypothetical protein